MSDALDPNRLTLPHQSVHEWLVDHRPDCVYFAVNRYTALKVGTAKDVRQRMGHLGKWPLLTIPGGRATEEEWHRRLGFARLPGNGELFNFEKAWPIVADLLVTSWAKVA